MHAWGEVQETPSRREPIEPGADTAEMIFQAVPFQVSLTGRPTPWDPTYEPTDMHQFAVGHDTAFSCAVGTFWVGADRSDQPLVVAAVDVAVVDTALADAVVAAAAGAAGILASAEPDAASTRVIAAPSRVRVSRRLRYPFMISIRFTRATPHDATDFAIPG